MESDHRYSRVAKYDEYSMDLSKVYYRKIIREVTQFLKKGTILDVGCYDGSLGEIFLNKGYEVYGIEAHDGACTKACQKGIRVIKKNIEEGMPWEQDSFDCVIAAEIIEHLYDTDRFLNDIKRVLKKDGILVMSIPNVACFTNRLKLLLGSYPRYCEYQAGEGGGHIRVYTLKAIKDQLVQRGFEVLAASGANFPLPMHVKAIPLFIKKIAIGLGDYTPGLAGQIIITARNRKV
ncbi:MAG: class I SAM-dependent methyltransferase [Candidatus Omnitrophota bacterium]